MTTPPKPPATCTECGGHLRIDGHRNICSCFDPPLEERFSCGVVSDDPETQLAYVAATALEMLEPEARVRVATYLLGRVTEEQRQALANRLASPTRYTRPVLL